MSGVDNAIMADLAAQRHKQRQLEDAQVVNALRSFEEADVDSLRVAMKLPPHRASWLRTRLRAFERQGRASSRVIDRRRKYRAVG